MGRAGEADRLTRNRYSAAVSGLQLRFATREDVPAVLAMVRELAEFEKLSHICVADEATFSDSLFGAKPAAEALVAELHGEAVAFAVFFHTFSTFLGRAGLWLEDLYVRPHARRKGIGRALISFVAKIAVDRKCGRLEWSVLDWNTRAVDFYRSLGAVPLDDWTVQRVTGEALLKLGSG